MNYDRAGAWALSASYRTLKTGAFQMRNIVPASVILVQLAAFVTTTALAATGPPTVKIAVLDLLNDATISGPEIAYLTDRVRDAGIRTLADRRYLMMTRESINLLLPSGVRLSDCADAECEVEIGQMVGADHVVTGEVIRFGGELRLNLKVHHCGTTRFLGSESVGGATVVELEPQIGLAAAKLFELIARDTGTHGAPGPRFREEEIGEAPGERWSPGASGATVVRFESDPPGAVVLVDGGLVCQETPCSKALPVGRVRVSMQKERYVARHELVEIAAVEAGQTLAWSLEPDFGHVTVTSDPSGLAVLIDGDLVGTTPLLRYELSSGGHDVLVSDPLHYDKGMRILIGRGEHETVAVVPVPRNGALKVEAVDMDGDATVGRVFIDGEDAGTTYAPLTLLMGRHEVEVRGATHYWRGSVVIEEGRTTTMPVILEMPMVSPEEQKRRDLREQARRTWEQRYKPQRGFGIKLGAGMLTAGTLLIANAGDSEVRSNRIVGGLTIGALGVAAIYYTLTAKPAKSEEQVYQELLRKARLSWRLDGEGGLGVGVQLAYRF